MYGIDRRRLALLLLLPVLGIVAYIVGIVFVGSSEYRAAQEALERRDFRQARLHLEQYLEVRPGNLDARLLAAQTARRDGNFAASGQHLHIYAQQAGASTALDLEQRLLRVQQGELGEIDALQASIGAPPRSPRDFLIMEALVESSLLAVKQKSIPGSAVASNDADRATLLVDQWLQLRTGKIDKTQGFVWRGQLHESANDHAKARADYRQALELSPDSFQARMFLAVALFYPAPEEAAAHLQVLRARDPKNDHVRFSLATVQRNLGQLKEAGQLLDELLNAHPDNIQYLIERGYTALNAHQTDDAERFLRRALAVGPDAPDVHLALSGCLELAGKTAEAKYYHERGRQLDNEFKQKRNEMKGKKAAFGN
ncbi:MAG: tetratricopeptide repeat protein [Gemmataceae bacterium]|nr:tetratricopeptide repeat protein [Gemmataceae bacterium]